MTLIDEYRFPHSVFQLGKEEMNGEGLKYGYMKMAQFLELSKKQNCGLTLILTPQWMYLSLIERPYHYETELDVPGAKCENGTPVYLDGFAYGGIINLQTVE